MGANFTLVCKDKVQVTWRVPEPVMHSVEIEVEDSLDANYPFAARLTIPAVDHTYVGFYYCVQSGGGEDISNANINELVDNFNATPFYIFVDGEWIFTAIFNCYNSFETTFLDPENLFVETMMVIHGTERETVIIPCKPTSKYVTVELLKDEEEVY